MSQRGFDQVITCSDFQTHLQMKNIQPERRDLITRDYIMQDYPYAGITSAEGEDFLEIWLCRRAEEWLRTQATSEQPFFCCISTPGPHPGYVVPESRANDYNPDDMPLWPNLKDDLAEKPAVQRLFRHVITQSGSLSDDVSCSLLRLCNPHLF